MSEEEDHVEVVLDEPKLEKKDEPEVEIVEEKAEAAPEIEKTSIIEPEEGIQELKRRLEAEKQARIEAEKQAYQSNLRAERANNDVKDANYQLVVNAIETLKDRSDALKAAYKEATIVGDADKTAELIDAITVNSQQLAELKRGETAMKQAMKEAEEAAQRQPVRPVPPTPADAIEQMAQNTSPRSAAWLRENKSNLSSEREIRRMFRAHEDAIDEGITTDTDEYFAFVESRLGLRKREAPEPASEAAAPAPKRAPQPPPAPVSRSNQRSNVVRLTREQADTAQMLGMTENEYAKHMVALQKEGKIGR